MSWSLDTAHSQIGFSVKHLMVSTVRGRFSGLSGTFDIHEGDPAASHFEVSVDVASATTGDDNRDGHLRNADFFEVEKYPTATYKSTRIEKIGENEFRINGVLTLHGVTHDVPLTATLEGLTADMQGNRRAGFTVTGSLSRKDFGLTWNVALESGGVAVSDKVSLNIDAEVVEQAAVTA